MSKYYFAVPCQNEIGEYIQEGEHTDFPRGTFLAYHNCCLVVGFKTKEEAVEWNKTHTCPKTKNKRR